MPVIIFFLVILGIMYLLRFIASTIDRKNDCNSKFKNNSSQKDVSAETVNNFSVAENKPAEIIEYIVRVDGIVYGKYDSFEDAKQRLYSVASDYYSAIIQKKTNSDIQVVFSKDGQKKHNTVQPANAVGSRNSVPPSASYQASDLTITNNLLASADPRVKEIYNYLVGRGVKRLVHFTPAKNLQSILTKGIIPRANLNSESAMFLDSQRLENMRDCSCFSFSFPNYKMFYKYQKLTNQSFVVLFIDISYLLTVKYENLYFLPSNAASGRYAGRCNEMHGLNAVQAQFALTGRDKGIPDSFTTNPQAEILIRSVVPPSFIKEIHFKTRSDFMSFGSNIPNRYNTSVSNTYFSYRSDYQNWTFYS